MGERLRRAVREIDWPNETMRLILASKSPRRLEILQHMGLQPEVAVAGVDEEAAVHPGMAPRAYVLKLAGLKAGAVSERLGGKPAKGAKATGELALALAADTTVTLDGAYLNKPADADEARAMLRRLSGRAHDVLTGVCLSRLGTVEMWLDAAKTRVVFRELSVELIERYVASGSPLDKAGAYGIQDSGGEFPIVDHIEGDFWNVMGLPVAVVAAGLKHFGAGDGLTLPIPPKPWG